MVNETSKKDGSYFGTSSLEIGDNSQYADDNKVNTDQIIEYLGEYHHDNAENKAGYPHPQT
jgi:hypothetical protein